MVIVEAIVLRGEPLVGLGRTDRNAQWVDDWDCLEGRREWKVIVHLGDRGEREWIDARLGPVLKRLMGGCCYLSLEKVMM